MIERNGWQAMNGWLWKPQLNAYLCSWHFVAISFKLVISIRVPGSRHRHKKKLLFNIIPRLFYTSKKLNDDDDDDDE